MNLNCRVELPRYGDHGVIDHAEYDVSGIEVPDVVDVRRSYHYGTSEEREYTQ